jgi:hypothetical protein
MSRYDLFSRGAPWPPRELAVVLIVLVGGMFLCVVDGTASYRCLHCGPAVAESGPAPPAAIGTDHHDAEEPGEQAGSPERHA